MDKRTFYFKDGSSDKFWAIQLEGSSHTVNYGKTGTSGTTQTKDFPTESAARKSYEKLIAEKLKKGYVEEGAKTSTSSPESQETNFSQSSPEPISVPPLKDQRFKPDSPPPPESLDLILKDLKISKKITWITPEELPSIQVGEDHLSPDQMSACLIALQKSSLAQPHPFLQWLKIHANPQSLDQFAWTLFETWLNLGAASKEKWALTAIGHLGSDASALKLTPMIKVWPGQSQHARAVLGLECLRAIGTDTALMQIHGISQKLKYQGLKNKAAECLKAIAQERKLTREQLEDRIIPDLDLDERGSRWFDFGPRQFQFLLGEDLKPLIRYPDGKIKKDLPKPNSKDDPDQASQAIADWKLMKKQLAEVIKIQVIRLEQAMVQQRLWTGEEFQTLLVKHPLMTLLVQRLIWGGYDAKKQLIKTFRVAEDQTYADVEDEMTSLEEVTWVGVIHPIHLEPDLKSQWAELITDYEIVPPFPQLGRPLFLLSNDELSHDEITRFQEIQIPIPKLVRTLENRGWLKGGLRDHGDYCIHYKPFPEENLVAIVGEYEHVFVDLSVFPDEQEELDGCCFVANVELKPESYPDKQWTKHIEKMPLAKVSPLILSEVLWDLTTVTS